MAAAQSLARWLRGNAEGLPLVVNTPGWVKVTCVPVYRFRSRLRDLDHAEGLPLVVNTHGWVKVTCLPVCRSRSRLRDLHRAKACRSPGWVKVTCLPADSYSSKKDLVECCATRVSLSINMLTGSGFRGVNQSLLMQPSWCHS